MSIPQRTKDTLKDLARELQINSYCVAKGLPRESTEILLDEMVQQAQQMLATIAFAKETLACDVPR